MLAKVNIYKQSRAVHWQCPGYMICPDAAVHFVPDRNHQHSHQKKYLIIISFVPSITPDFFN
jgi:hypothetical protein